MFSEFVEYSCIVLRTMMEKMFVDVSKEASPMYVGQHFMTRND